MKLESVEAFAVAPPTGIGGRFWILVRVTTDDGVHGVGECYGIPFAPPIACALVEDVFARYLAGEQPQRIETMFRRVYSTGFTQRPDPTVMSVFSGIEMAVWDILGKAHGVPVHELLGGRFHDRLRTYTYLYPRWVHDPSAPSDDGDPYHEPEAAAARALEYVAEGWTAIKQDPTGPYSFQGGRELSLRELERSVQNIRAVRAAVGSEADILVGTHGQMTTGSAIRLARLLEPFDPMWFEEPVPPDQVDGLARVSAATSLPIATGERLTTRAEFHAVLQAGVAVVQPNVGRAGGILETKKIAVLAELFNAQFAPHIYCGPVAHAAAAHVAFSSPNFSILETIHTPFHSAIVRRPLDWDAGYLRAPSAPGLGVELDDAVVHAHGAAPDSPLHLEMTQVPLSSNNSLTAAEIEQVDDVEP
ncbi:MAG: mandelate racemase/muconate lactonizing enzyme family protein [Acidimicrobiales bacterium]|nr:mandelate racemase/muconate lactonizing enzyme family protein [Acidimicrobiales bacterium]